jgi:hypothetical protein
MRERRDAVAALASCEGEEDERGTDATTPALPATTPHCRRRGPHCRRLDAAFVAEAAEICAKLAAERAASP